MISLRKYARMLLLLVWGIYLAGTVGAVPVGINFTYQGRLSDTGAVANGIYDLRFSLWDTASGGVQVGSTVTNAAAIISNGFFSVVLDFGTNAFDGNARWLEVGVRKGGGAFTALSPRQPLTPAPYAVTAINLANPAGIVAGTFTGSFSGDGFGLTNLNAAPVTAATNALWNTTTNWVLAQGYQVTNGLTRKPIATVTPSDGTNFIVDFGKEVVQLAATNHINLFQSTNRPGAGYYGECVWYIQGGTTNWTLRVNTNWIGIGSLAANTPYMIVSNRLTILALSARSNSETNVSYAIARQE
jgi:hypothetical protein